LELFLSPLILIRSKTDTHVQSPNLNKSKSPSQDNAKQVQQAKGNGCCYFSGEMLTMVLQMLLMKRKRDSRSRREMKPMRACAHFPPNRSFVLARHFFDGILHDG
jgi:hypothetical protein